MPPIIAAPTTAPPHRLRGAAPDARPGPPRLHAVAGPGMITRIRGGGSRRGERGEKPLGDVRVAEQVVVAPVGHLHGARARQGGAARGDDPAVAGGPERGGASRPASTSFVDCDQS
ncbi:hypothetical protein GCM10010282_19350 [Streptomyces roseolus]|nr:hypothetical protein GCM10010282_19350 [Streptomyces roseolus]